MYSVCIYRCILITVVSYYDKHHITLSVLSVMGFQKKVWLGGGGVLSKFFWNLFNFAKPLSVGAGQKTIFVNNQWIPNLHQ